MHKTPGTSGNWQQSNLIMVESYNSNCFDQRLAQIIATSEHDLRGSWRKLDSCEEGEDDGARVLVSQASAEFRLFINMRAR